MKCERLTKSKWTNDNCKPAYDKNGDIVMDKELFDLLITEHNRLAEYEDDEESGKIVRLPCKVGDTVYLVYSFAGICEWEIDEIVIMQKSIRLRLTHKGTKDLNFAFLSETGETLFFSREEAEKKLQELKE